MIDAQGHRTTFVIPKHLLQQIDNLVNHTLSSRSDIIRLALLEYVCKPEHKLIANPDKVAVEKAYKYIQEDHPYLNPNDTEMIMLLSEQKAAKERPTLGPEV